MKIRSTIVLCLVLMFSTWIRADEINDEIKNVDPWEGWNRKVFAFNDALDKAVLRPLAKGYIYITPGPVEGGISRMFGNLGEILNTFNDLLQGKFKQAGNDTGRFLINSTLGLAGFFEVADKMGLPQAEGEDFGQTLGSWGVGSGRYIVLPLLGPSSLRDAPSRIVDTFLNPIYYIDDVPLKNSLYGASIISTRADLLDAEELLQGDKYSLMRDAYLQRRQHLILDGEVEDDFGDFEDY